jgi:hypothetical protein
LLLSKALSYTAKRAVLARGGSAILAPLCGFAQQQGKLTDNSNKGKILKTDETPLVVSKKQFLGQSNP